MPDAGQPVRYLGNQKGRDFLDGARQFELTWLYTCRERGIWRLWWLIYCGIHGIDPQTGKYNTTQELQFVGSEAQYALFRVQMARRFIQQRKMMAQDQRPSFTGVATNNDVASLAQVNISTKAIDYMLTEAKLEQAGSKALGSLCNYGMGGLFLSWDYEGGDKVPAKEPERKPDGSVVLMPVTDDAGNPVVAPNPETGEEEQQLQPVMRDVQKKSGAPRIRKGYPWQIVYDPYLEEDHPALVIKTPVNKYELAAKFKEKYDEIIGLSIDDELGDDAMFAWGGTRTVSSDTIVLRQYFHRNCEAVPGGRWAGYVKGVALWGVDEIIPCPLDNGIPVKIMMGPNYHGTGFGYPESGDLLSLQTVLNELVSMGVTNAQKRGNPNAYKRDDVQVDQESWSAGGMLFDLPAGAPPPTWDEPPKMDTLSQYLIEFVSEQMRLMLGSNSVTEGNPDANITSGAFAVLLVNVAQKYANDLQEAYDTALTEIANDALELTRKNAENGFWAEIAGIGDAPYAQIISKDKLNTLRRVKLVRQSPVLSTFVGRTEVFDRTIMLPKADRADAMDMLLTGRSDSYAERDQAARIRIRKENEQLLQGINPVVTVWDDHALEGREHRMQYDKLRTMDPPEDGPQTPPPQLPPDHPDYQLVQEQWLATGGPDFARWYKACQAHESHLQQHAQALATAPPPIAAVAGWVPLVAAAPAGGPEQQNPEQQQGKPGKPGGGSPGGGKNAPKPPQSPKPPQQPKGAGGMASNV
jgi:hypothetical protein